MVMVHAIQFERNSPKLLPHIVDERNDEHLLNEVILMQFTGLLDSKGVEIYEGDLVKYKTCEQGKDDEYYEETKVVHFHLGSFGFQEWFYDEGNKLTENLYSISNATSTFYRKNYDAEVIGNIHEKGVKNDNTVLYV